MNFNFKLVEPWKSDKFMVKKVRKKEKFDYTIVASKYFRANTNYTLNLTIHDPKCEFDEPVVVRISIENADNKEQSELVQDVTMIPNVTESISFSIGDIAPDQDYKLVAKGISGISMKHEARLELQTRTHSILLQTDKAIYKPNDCIKFRVFVLDLELKAAKLDVDELSISITDPCRNLIKKWKNVEVTNGVFSGEFQLADLPNLGDWKITAKTNEKEKTTTIAVAEYVLPKFEVTIDSNDHFTLDDETVTVTIRAKYTHGKALRGKAIVTVTENDNYGYHRYHEQLIPEQNALIKKTIDIDGSETIEFNIKNELKFEPNEGDYLYDKREFFKIHVEVTEMLTGIPQEAHKMIEIYANAFEITSNLREIGFTPDSTVPVMIKVRKYDGSHISFNTPEKKKITLICERSYQCGIESTESETVHELDENGNVSLFLSMDRDEYAFGLKTIYQTQVTYLGEYYARSHSAAVKIDLDAKILTENCCINREIEVELMSHYSFPTYTYQIVARGMIMESKTIVTAFDPNDSEFRHRFTFLPTFDYAPKVQIVIYFVKDESIVSKNVGVDLLDDFNNFIELDVAPDSAEPGQTVDLVVKSNPNSYIGLLGIDKSVLLLRSGNDLTSKEIWKELELFGRNATGQSSKDERSMPAYFNERLDFRNAGLITFTNIIAPRKLSRYCCRIRQRSANFCSASPDSVDDNSLDDTIEMKSKSFVPPKIRKEFPETWIWETFECRASDGLLKLKKKVPDSLTSWVLTGFSIHPENGLAITKIPANLRVEQQFHISLNLPYSVKRGEVVTIPCSIFNYLQSDVGAEVTLENQDGEFEFIDEAIDDKIYPELKKQPYRQKKTFVRTYDAVNVNFTIRPIKIGTISLKVTAASSKANDCIIKPLNVECEGVTQFVNKAVFIDLREKSKTETYDVKIDIPKEALPDSSRIEITCVGDLLGGTIKNLQHLIRLPYGCGEQNMLNFVPNIVVLNYLKNTQQLMPEIEAKAKKFMEIGYQRELTYKHKDGSFSAFGDSDKFGSTWLTAFVARSFRQAADHIVIQDQIIDKSLKWLAELQAEDGSFKEKGSVCHKEMQSGAANGVALTAYVLTAFLVNKDSNNTYAQVIEKAIANILQSIKTLDDVYAVAVIAYALQLADHSAKKELSDRLVSMAKSDENHQWWEKTIDTGSYYKQSKMLNVEISAYALLTLSSSEKNFECLRILKWLLNQRNDQGGFEGTQDTIVGLEALASFVPKIFSKETEIKIELNADLSSEKFHFDVNQDNALVLQSHRIPSDTKAVKVSASGKGFALVEISYRYNTKEVEPMPAFELKTKVYSLYENLLNLEITTKFQPTDDSKQSNMAVMEVEMPSGYIINTQSLESLKSFLPIVKRIETKNSETVGIIYFDNISTEALTLKINGFREHAIDEQKPASIFIYDYYDNSLCAREFYSIESNQMEIDNDEQK